MDVDKKIKIFYLTTTPKIAGAEKQLFELAKRLDKNKYDIFVCTIMGEERGELLKKLRNEDVRCGSLNINSKWHFLKIIKLIFLLRKENPDILQSFLFFDNILARIFGKIIGIPIIISGQRNVETYRSKLRNFIEKKTIFLSDYIVSNTRAGKDILINREKLSENRIKVIYNGIELEPINNHKNDNNNITIGFIGRLEEQKGISFLLEALAILNNNKIRLLIVGDGKEQEKLKLKARELKIDNCVKFLGRKENAWECMKIFDIFILPSLWEGMPNVILEAMSQEKLIISTSVGGVSEMITDGENGFLVDPGKPKQLAEKINYVIGLSEEEKIRIGENARKTVEKNFSIGRMVEEYENLYKDLLTNKKL